MTTGMRDLYNSAMEVTMNLIISLRTAPVFEGDEERTQNARLLHVIVWVFMMPVTVILAIGTLVLPENTLHWLLLISVVDTICLLSLGLNRSGYTRLDVSAYPLSTRHGLKVR